MRSAGHSPRTRVWFVDDEPAIGQWAAMALGSLECDVHAVCDGTQFAALMQQQQAPDIVVLDLNLGGASGLSLWRTWRQQLTRTDWIPCSGMVNAETLGELRDGVRETLQKPFTAAEFRAVIERVIRRRAGEGE